MNYSDNYGEPLSDGSNDSFFDDPKPRKQSLSNVHEKKAVSDLFNITDTSQNEKTSRTPKKAPDEGLGVSFDKQLPDSRNVIGTKSASKKINFLEDDDILGSLGLNTKPKNQGETVTDIPSKKTTDLFESVLKTPSKTAEDSAVISSDSKIKTPSYVAQHGEGPREGRRGRRPSVGVMDPLGLFSTNVTDKQSETTNISKKPEPKQREIDVSFEQIQQQRETTPTLSKSSPNIYSKQSLPDWLYNSGIKQSKSEDILNQATKNEQLKANLSVETSEFETSKTVPEEKFIPPHVSEDIDSKSTTLGLQQQESQLLMVLHMKKYEEHLKQMQQKQQEMLLKQEKRMNDLLESQRANQQVTENNMQIQQERINQYLHLLLAQFPRAADEYVHFEIKNNPSSADENEKQESEDALFSLKQKHNDDLIFLEESYKKRINILDETLASVETRLKQEIDKNNEQFEEKIKSVNLQHQKDIDMYKQKLDEMQASHYAELKDLRTYHDQVVDQIKHEHASIVESIKEGKNNEASLFSGTHTIMEKLDTNIEFLMRNSKRFEDLNKEVTNEFGIFSIAREESLKARENEIQLMKESLEKCRKTAEEERAQLLGLVRSLETKISEQSQNSREERWAFQQAASTLTARSTALDRETEFNRACLEREREQLKTLKESILAEREKMFLELTEEKLQLATEKMRLETANRLNSNIDLQRTKSEIDAAVQVAEEAAKMTDRERENLYREKCEVEKLKRTLLDQQRKLSSREKELGELEKDAEIKISEGERAAQESKFRENQYNETLKDLQRQIVVLSNKEKKIAEEKIILVKERLALNSMMKQMKKCGLCNADKQMWEGNDVNMEVNTIFYSPSYQNVDNDVVHLRREALEETDDVELNGKVGLFIK